jgi:hypothetical protein
MNTNENKHENMSVELHSKRDDVALNNLVRKHFKALLDKNYPKIEEWEHFFGLLDEEAKMMYFNKLLDLEKQYQKENPSSTLDENVIMALYDLEAYLPTPTEPTNAPTEPTNAPTNLPSELDTDRARKYFARAVEVRYMTPTDTGYKWLHDSCNLASLGYFVERVYCPTNTEKIHETAINVLFGVNRIGRAISQMHDAKRPQKWKKLIDETIFFD